MAEHDSIECNSAACNPYETHNIYPNLNLSLSDKQQFRLNKINEIKDYFVAEIKKKRIIEQKPSSSKKLLPLK